MGRPRSPARRRRSAERGDARPFHARAQRPYRHCNAVFPENTSGAQLDPLARKALLAGSGSISITERGTALKSYLSVHEGPARISKLGTIALRRGMILSNEPGYYKTAAYGIRIENLVLVIAAPEPVGAEKPLNAFETLTLAPIDRRLIPCPSADVQGTRRGYKTTTSG